jgi:hypothetical protein
MAATWFLPCDPHELTGSSPCFYLDLCQNLRDSAALPSSLSLGLEPASKASMMQVGTNDHTTVDSGA